jgi:RNA polymerase sigma factor (sigma-70 family)
MVEAEGRDLGSLIRQAARGDAEARGALVRQFADLVYSVILKERVPEQDRDDIFQATFLSFFKWLDRISKPERVASWLITTTQRLCWRRSVRPAPDWLAPTAAVIDPQTPDPQHAAALSEERAALVRGLAELNPRCRRLLTMLHAEDQSYETVSQELGMPAGAIGPTRARCLRQLRRILHATEDED